MPLQSQEDDQSYSPDGIRKSGVLQLPTTAGPRRTQHHRRRTTDGSSHDTTNVLPPRGQVSKMTIHQSNNAKGIAIVELARRILVFTGRQDIEEGRGVRTPWKVLSAPASSKTLVWRTKHLRRPGTESWTHPATRSGADTPCVAPHSLVLEHSRQRRRP